MPITIEEALLRIPVWQHASAAAVSPLTGGITNHNYRVDIGGESFVVRIGVEGAGLLGIDRHREYRCAVAASRAGVAPEVVCFLPESGVMVTRFVAGRHLPPGEAPGPGVVERVVRAVRQCHAGLPFEGPFSPFGTLDDYLRVARRLDAPLPGDTAEMYRPLPAVEAALRPDRRSARPCHNDLWGPNLIDDGRGVCLVDWEYAGMGDVFFDLANFAIHHSPSDADDEALLKTYFGATSDAAFARLKLLRMVAELREAMWYMVALGLPTAMPDFIEHASTHFHRYRTAADDPRLASWLALAGDG